MRKFICVICTLLLASCSSVLTDIASFKDPDFENREPVKVMALIVNNTTMQNINRVQFALNELLKEENIDVKFLDHYLINPPTRTLSEKDLRKSLTTKWGADALLFVNVISETGKVKGVDGDYVDADEGLKEKGKSDKYTTIAYGKYTASLLDVKTWRTIWKADLIAIDEKFKNTKAMYRLAAEKIVLDLLDKKLVSVISDKNKNNITEYDKRIISLRSPVTDVAKNNNDTNVQQNQNSVKGGVAASVATINESIKLAKKQNQSDSSVKQANSKDKESKKTTVESGITMVGTEPNTNISQEKIENKVEPNAEVRPVNKKINEKLNSDNIKNDDMSVKTEQSKDEIDNKKESDKELEKQNNNSESEEKKNNSIFR